LIFPAELNDFFSGRSDAVTVLKSGPGTWAAMAHELRRKGLNVVVVTPGKREMDEVLAVHRLFAPQEEAKGPVSFLSDGTAVFPPYVPGEPGVEAWCERWKALYSLRAAKGPQSIFLSVDNFLPLWPRPEVIESHHLELRKGEEILIESIIEQAVTWGYKRVKMVTKRGETAVRGDIVDIFCPGFDMPVRLEFFGDTLTDIRLFDPSSQRSKVELQELILLPTVPSLVTEDLKDAALEKFKRLKSIGELSGEALYYLEQKVDAEDGRILPGLFYEKAVPMRKLLPKDCVFLLCGGGAFRTNLEDVEARWKAWLDEAVDLEERRFPRNEILQPLEASRSAWVGKKHVVFEELSVGETSGAVSLPEKPIRAFEDLFWKPEARHRPWQTFMESLKTWSKERRQTILSFHSDRSRQKFLELSEHEGIKPRLSFSDGEKGLFALISPLSRGLELDWNRMTILSEDVIQPRARSYARVGKDKEFQGLEGYDDLVEGALLVHRDWGLGRFGGLKRMNIGGAANDYLLLEYAGDDKLYLPVDRLNLVQRYKGPEGANPSLDKMGGAAWRKTKDRAKKAIEKIAHELVEMYAYRKIAKGYDYGQMNELYWEFEASFGFEETPDQAKAIKDVLSDLELPEPMDRLVCGDVGFGKTEVALRAAFRAAMSGKQVAILCPTTVLAEQHYRTFKSRLEDFPMRVGMLSRFVPPKEQKAVLADVARGRVDILIGTHRLLSKDVEIPNLGLMILDEEQRFGVKNKERLKEFRKNIDVLALTATPIPRTLQLSLSGIRSLSVIETPPVDRKPVHSSLLERDDAALKKVLLREMERKGQIFWVYNRVQGLERVAEYVKKLVPEIRIAMAHGQMRERELEKAMHDFQMGEVDVLVCTAIVESGLDFPRANTLVVDQAQLFGLGQLYQLRGRVGRSSEQAYAYFIVPSAAKLPETSRKRLQVILEMDYLGAGFKVAMEDLRLRGAGNILGEAQSGSIERVGLDLYMEMLAEEVARLKGEGVAAEKDTELNILFTANIPEEFIPDSVERLRYYKAMTTAKDDMDTTELLGEMADRFGRVPEEVHRFTAVLALKRLLTKAGAAKADLYPNRMIVTWEQDAGTIAPERMIAWLGHRKERAKMVSSTKLELRVPGEDNIETALRTLESDMLDLIGDDENASAAAAADPSGEKVSENA
jgi:transcription-repair coupling factor (superfamily II helicase)